MKSRLLPLLILLLLSGLMACSDISLPTSRNSAVPTATPPANVMRFVVPAYTVSLPPGGVVPGTQLEYIGQNRDTYMVKIRATETPKRSGDSFIWHGVLGQGVYAHYNLRLTTAVLGELPVAGTVEVLILNPILQQSDLPADLTGYLQFSNIIIGHTVTAGEVIPGTTAVYEGTIDQQGNQLAQVSGANSFPTLAVGDSIVWSGRIRENVYIRYNLRVATISDNTLRIAGTASLWVDPRSPNP